MKRFESPLFVSVLGTIDIDISIDLPERCADASNPTQAYVSAIFVVWFAEA